MKKYELLVKSREAMMSAVQIYNNPQVTFKSETFISLAVIAWTYLLHTYYANKNIDYRYFKIKGKRKVYDKTKFGAYKHWELQRCLDDKKSPIDTETANNLKFLIGIRHEIEHQMTKKIDNSISAKIQACSINYNYYIKKLFGDEKGVDQQLSFAIQFSPIEPEQKEMMFQNDKLSTNVQSFITQFENDLSDDDIRSPKYAYRLLFTRISAKRRNQADQVIEFIPEGTEGAENINRTYTLIKETEKKKYQAKDVVEMMHQKGHSWFNTAHMTKLWKEKLNGRDGYGVFITDSQWLWYENWIPVVEKYCEEMKNCQFNKEKDEYFENDIVELMKKKGYKFFSGFWLQGLWKNLNIDRENTKYGYYNHYRRYVWRKCWIPIVEDFCAINESKFRNNDHKIEIDYSITIDC